MHSNAVALLADIRMRANANRPSLFRVERNFFVSKQEEERSSEVLLFICQRDRFSRSLRAE